MYDYTRYISKKTRVRFYVRVVQFLKRNWFTLLIIGCGLFIIWAYNSALYYEEPEINKLVVNGDTVYLPIK